MSLTTSLGVAPTFCEISASIRAYRGLRRKLISLPSANFLVQLSGIEPRRLGCGLSLLCFGSGMLRVFARKGSPEGAHVKHGLFPNFIFVRQDYTLTHAAGEKEVFCLFLAFFNFSGRMPK